MEGHAILVAIATKRSKLTFPPQIVENLQVHDDCDAAVVRLYVYEGP